MADPSQVSVTVSASDWLMWTKEVMVGCENNRLILCRDAHACLSSTTLVSWVGALEVVFVCEFARVQHPVH